MKLKTLLLLGVLPLVLHAAPATPSKTRFAQPAQKGEMVSVLISNGDNDIVYNVPPLDTPENIDAFFEILQKVYGVQRIYWRAAQIEQIVHHSHLRPEYFTFHLLADYLQKSYSKKATSPTTTGPASAKAHGMEIYGWAALFDHGGHEVIDSGKGFGPSPVESLLRLKHPEWVPRDRYDLRRMSGTLCFSYPEARKALVKQFLTLALQGGYDGMFFHTYVEQFGVRNENEFGFSDAIAKEYSRRYGVDPRTQPYDSQKLAEVRGHFLTLFFRELRKAFRPHGIKISLALDPKRPDRPAPWLSSHQRDFSPAGNIEIDWKRYIDENLVDELISYANGPNLSLARELLQYAGAKGVKVGILHSTTYPQEAADFPAAGVNRIISGQYADLEYGYFAPIPDALLESGDFIDKISVLHQMTMDPSRWNLDAVLKATGDSHPYVRRGALAGLMAHSAEGEAVQAVIAKRLGDPVNAVRSYAVAAAFALGGPGMVPLVLNRVAERFEPPVVFAATPGLANLKDAEALGQALRHGDPRIRYLGLQAFGRGKHRVAVPPEFIALAADPDPRVRWAVAANALRYRTPEMTDALFKQLDDEHPTVRAAAAVTLSTMYQSTSRWLTPVAYQVWEALASRFTRYGKSYDGRDRQWGWRPLGESLQRMGPRGEEVLRNTLAQEEDKTLAARAWEILYTKTNTSTFEIISDEAVQASLEAHPKVRKSAPAKVPTVEEPKWITWFEQTFDWTEPQFTKSGTIGDPRSAGARWQGLEGKLRDGKGWIDTRNEAPVPVFGVRHDEPIRSGRLRAHLALQPENFGEGLAIWLTQSGQYSSTVQLSFDPKGELYTMTEGGRRQPTGFTAPPGEPLALDLEVDLDRRVYRVAIGETVLVDDLPLKAGEFYNTLVFLPSRSVLVRLDQVKVTVPNPAYLK